MRYVINKVAQGTAKRRCRSAWQASKVEGRKRTLEKARQKMQKICFLRALSPFTEIFGVRNVFLTPLAGRVQSDTLSRACSIRQRMSAKVFEKLSIFAPSAKLSRQSPRKCLLAVEWTVKKCVCTSSCLSRRWQ